MSIPKKEAQELWVGWTRDAMSSYVAPSEIDDNEDLVDDMVAVATDYADAMFEEYESRFDSEARKPRRPRKAKKSKTRPKEDEDEDDDEEEDEDDL